VRQQDWVKKTVSPQCIIINNNVQDGPRCAFIVEPVCIFVLDERFCGTFV